MSLDPLLLLQAQLLHLLLLVQALSDFLVGSGLLGRSSGSRAWLGCLTGGFVRSLLRLRLGIRSIGRRLLIAIRRVCPRATAHEDEPRLRV